MLRFKPYPVNRKLLSRLKIDSFLSGRATELNLDTRRVALLSIAKCSRTRQNGSDSSGASRLLWVHHECKQRVFKEGAEFALDKQLQE